ncbi:MAG: beta-lactamase family protein [Acidobacteria bacterium]|nr:beta-lactamase family protein [Acidobacteriota bacterium]
MHLLPRIRAASSVLLLPLLSVQPLSGQSIEELALNEVEGRTPALGLGLIHQGELDFFETWGVADRSSEAPFAAESLVPAPWLSPVLLATLVRALDARGQLDADQPIGRLLPSLPDAVRGVTLSDLLGHAAGLDDAPRREGRSWEEELTALPSNAVLGEPGQFYSTSRYSYPLVLHVVEQALEMPFADAVETALFGPLGMVNSTFEPPTPSSVVQGYDWVGGESGIAPVPAEDWDDTGLPVAYSTPAEILQFMAALGSGTLPGMDPWANAPRGLVPLHGGRSFVDGFWAAAEADPPARYSLTWQGQGHWARLRIYPDTRTVYLVLGTGMRPVPMLAEVDRRVATGVGDVEGSLTVPGEPRVTVTGSDAPNLPAIVDPSPWAGRYRNGELLVVLNLRDGRLHYFDGREEFPLVQRDDGRWHLDREGFSAPPITLFETADGRYAYFMEKVYVREAERD